MSLEEPLARLFRQSRSDSRTLAPATNGAKIKAITKADTSIGNLSHITSKHSESQTMPPERRLVSDGTGLLGGTRSRVLRQSKPLNVLHMIRTNNSIEASPFSFLNGKGNAYAYALYMYDVTSCAARALAAAGQPYNPEC